MSDTGNNTLATLAGRLERPAMSLSGLETLDAVQLQALDASIATAQDTHRRALDEALARAIPLPLRTAILHWLRR